MFAYGLVLLVAAVAFSNFRGKLRFAGKMGVGCSDPRAFLSGHARGLDAANACGSARSGGASGRRGRAVDGSAVFYPRAA